MLKLTFKIILITVICVSGAICQTSKVMVEKGKQIVYKDCSTPYELRVLSTTYAVGHVFLLSDAKYFNRKDLSVLFRCLSKKYEEFPNLRVTVFSERENLEIAIKNHFYPPPDSNPPADTSVEDCKNPTFAVRPCPIGYFRAHYLRSDDMDLFYFSDNPSSIEEKKVFLSKRLRKYTQKFIHPEHRFVMTKLNPYVN